MSTKLNQRYAIKNLRVFNSTGAKITPHPKYEAMMVINGEEEVKFSKRYRVLTNNKLESQKSILGLAIIGGPEETRKWLWDRYQQNKRLHWRNMDDVTGIDPNTKDWQEWDNYFSILTLVKDAYLDETSTFFIFINNEAVRPIAEVIKRFGQYYLEQYFNQSTFDIAG